MRSPIADVRAALASGFAAIGIRDPRIEHELDAVAEALAKLDPVTLKPAVEKVEDKP